MSDGVYRVILDTNVIIEGLTKKNGVCGLLIDAWLAGLLQVCVSNALAYEYIDVFSRKFTPTRWQKAKIVLRTLLERAEFISIYYSLRPASPDPGDDLVIDCAMNANALLVTTDVKDFRKAQIELGLHVLTPLEFAMILAD